MFLLFLVILQSEKHYCACFTCDRSAEALHSQAVQTGFSLQRVACLTLICGFEVWSSGGCDDEPLSTASYFLSRWLPGCGGNRSCPLFVTGFMQFLCGGQLIDIHAVISADDMKELVFQIGGGRLVPDFCEGI